MTFAARFIDDLDVGIAFHDPESGAFVDANGTLLDLYGYPIDELRDLSVGDITADASEHTEAEGLRRIRAAAEGTEQTFEWRIKRSNNRLIWARVTLKRTTYDGDEYVLAIVRDITEYKERTRRLRLLHRVLRHNLRNEMNKILGYAQMVEEAVEDEPVDRQAALLADTAREVAGLSESIRNLEALTRESGAKREPRDLGTVVDSVARQRAEDAIHATVETVHYDEALVTADESVEKALSELLENAIEHNQADSPHVLVSVDTESGNALVTIEDDGPGIPSTELESLADEERLTAVSHGSGIGLWIAKWCVESIGGSFTVAESDDEGTTVEVRIPLRTGRTDAVAASRGEERSAE